ncbi:FtsH protease activity modulator HflK [Buchnera aphidicola (Hyadaphis tataricae)]|uniref:Protein HflK n=1 Tax=Buchnera aphidicola (Hyadaphis tataricae) TaxID=1241859 RepID=A0A4D6Y695_9GAMM|nr:FtsH protease activity modulator HflK [Buchnera aphidicola]QCI21838.1 FtsH protease activity modulator HflK [Buchnera aphidicola (Hyadaphis tataricae)]
MTWNQQNHHQSELDPWRDKKHDHQENKNNKYQKNYILEIKNFFYDMKKFIITNGYSPSSSKKTLHPLLTIMFVSILIWSFSGFYTIKATERGVITHFGKFTHLVEPGLHWRPVFINEVSIVNVETVRDIATSGTMLTADQNVVHVEMNVQYKITDPKNYLFSLSYPDDSLRQATDSALRGVIGRSNMDRVLTEGRTLVRSDTQKEIEQIIKPYHTGITILDVNFQTARPPEEVKASFDDAIAARENREQYVREAEAYSNEVQPKAHGKAQRILEEARAYASRIILEAQGEVARFRKILPEYKIAKKITLRRLYIESMERLLSHNKKIFVDKNNNSTFFLYLNDCFTDKKILNKDVLKKIDDKKSPLNVVKKNSNINYFSSLSTKNILEQRRINSIRTHVGSLGVE